MIFFILASSYPRFTLPSDRGRLFKIEDLVEWYGDRGIVGIDIHYVAHIVPPFPYDLIASHILGTVLAFHFLVGVAGVGLSIVKNGQSGSLRCLRASMFLKVRMPI